MASVLWVHVIIMLISGSLNTILMKHQTRQVLPEYDGGEAKGFDHPYLQTLFMMIGELFCLLVFCGCFRKTRDGASAMPSWNGQLLFIFPVLCDMTATTLVNYSYLMIPASVVQMTRGAIVFFTCLFSVVFLKRKQAPYQYVGVGAVMLGITLVSLSQVTGGVSDTASKAAMVGIRRRILLKNP